MECGLNKPRALSAIQTRASSMIRNTRRARIGLSSSDSVPRQDLLSSFTATRNPIPWFGLFQRGKQPRRSSNFMKKEY